MKYSKCKAHGYLSSLHSRGIEGYYYTAPDGQQMAFWTAPTAGVSAAHTHPFDEYVVCVKGQYVVLIGGKEVVLESGDEYVIPKGTEHACRRTIGTRTIHAFGGKRI